MISLLVSAIDENNNVTLNLWTVLIVVAILALIVFILRNVRR